METGIRALGENADLQAFQHLRGRASYPPQAVLFLGERQPNRGRSVQLLGRLIDKACAKIAVNSDTNY